MLTRNRRQSSGGDSSAPTVIVRGKLKPGYFSSQALSSRGITRGRQGAEADTQIPFNTSRSWVSVWATLFEVHRCFPRYLRGFGPCFTERDLNKSLHSRLVPPTTLFRYQVYKQVALLCLTKLCKTHSKFPKALFKTTSAACCCRAALQRALRRFCKERDSPAPRSPSCTFLPLLHSAQRKKTPKALFKSQSFPKSYSTVQTYQNDNQSCTQARSD